MNYEKAWHKLEKHLLDTMNESEVYTAEGLAFVAGLGNALTAMEVLEVEQ